MEIWKSIEGYENYEVSNLGRVKSLNYLRTGNVKLLRAGKNKKGYLHVTLNKNGKKKNMSIHRLVAQAFLPNPDNLPVINHKNEIKTDNRVENLEWCTVKYNNHYSRTWEKALPKSNEVRRKTVFQFTKYGEFIAEYPSTCEASRQTGVNQGNISMCCRGYKKYTHAGNYVWKYKEDE